MPRDGLALAELPRDLLADLLPEDAQTLASDLRVGAWHATDADQCQVATALAHAGIVAPHLNRLAAQVIPRMPRWTLASSTLHTTDARSDMASLGLAIRASHISIRTSSHAYAVAVDCDHTDWSTTLGELQLAYDLPSPTWIAVNPWKGTAHLVWWLEDAVLLEGKGARQGPIRLYEHVVRGLTHLLAGDPAFTGRLVKNPWGLGKVSSRQGVPGLPHIHEAWREVGRDAGLAHHTMHNSRPVTLAQLCRVLDDWQKTTGLKVPGRRKAAPAEDSLRGSRLFDTARHRVYAAWPLSREAVLDIIQGARSELGSPISDPQLRGMAKRMHGWCVKHLSQQGEGQRRQMDPVMASLPRSERQALAGRQTAAKRSSKTEADLLTAALQIIEVGELVTQAAVAEVAGRSLATVERLWRRPLATPHTLPPSVVATLRGALPPAGGSTSKTDISSSVSLADLARASRILVAQASVLRDVVVSLRDALRRLRRPGADPQLAVPPVPVDLLGDSQVQGLLAEVHLARQDAVRRAANRQRAADAAARKAVILTAGAQGDTATLDAEIRRIRSTWDARITGARTTELREKLEMIRGAQLKAVERWWHQGRRRSSMGRDPLLRAPVQQDDLLEW